MTQTQNGQVEKIAQELAKNGIEPTQEAINEVLKRGATSKAVRDYIASQTPAHNEGNKTKSHAKKSPSTSETIAKQESEMNRTVDSTQQAYEKLAQLRSDQVAADAVSDARRDAAFYLSSYQKEFLRLKAQGIIHVLRLNSQAGETANNSVDDSVFLDSLNLEGLDLILGELGETQANLRQVEQTARLHPAKIMALLNGTPD